MSFLVCIFDRVSNFVKFEFRVRVRVSSNSNSKLEHDDFEASFDSVPALRSIHDNDNNPLAYASGASAVIFTSESQFSNSCNF